jgi:type IV pilus assembly protein PilC
MSKFRDILNFQITPRRKKDKPPKLPPSSRRIDFDIYLVLLILAGPFGMVYFLFMSRKVRLRRMQQLFKCIRMIVQNNSPLAPGLKMMALDARDYRVRKVLTNLCSELEQGKSLADAMDRYRSVFQPRYVDLIRIGERTGRMGSTLDQIITSIEHRLDTMRGMMLNSVYILIVCGVQFTIASFLIAKVLPVFQEIFSNFGAVPYYSNALINVAQFLNDHILSILFFILVMMMFVAFLAVLCGFSSALRNAFSHILISIPLIGRMVRVGQLQRISEAVEECVQAGLPIDKVFRDVSEMRLMGLHRIEMERLAGMLESGHSLKDTLAAANGLFDHRFRVVLGLGDYTGNLAEACSRLKELYRLELTLRTAVASDAMLPAYAILGGAINLWILVSTYGMIFGLSDVLVGSL